MRASTCSRTPAGAATRTAKRRSPPRARPRGCYSTPRSSGARQVPEEAIQQLKHFLLRRVTSVVRAGFPRALLQGRSDQVVAVLPLGTEIADYQARSHALGLQIRQAIVDWKPGFTVSVGFSGPTEAPTGVAGGPPPRPSRARGPPGPEPRGQRA